MTPDLIPVFAQVAADGYGYPPGAETFRSYIKIPDASAFVGYVNGKTAASGAFSINRCGAASLYLGSTWPEYRGQGCQLTLTAARLQVAMNEVAT